MSSEDVDIRLRTRGGRRAAADADRVGRSVGGIGRQARRSAGDVRLFSRATAGAGRGLRVTAGAALYGGAALGGALVVGIKRSSDAWEESRKVTAQTGAVLRATGGVANVTARDVGSLAGALSRKTAVDDEAIQKGANLLLTFKRIRNEAGAGNRIFDRATTAAVDLSAAGFGSIESTSKQLGKALNDPLKGITALGRAGVTFTQGQRDQIESMVEANDTLGAQRIILREVESQVGGSAAAQATALGRLKVSWGNIEEAVGKGASPAIDAFAGKLDRALVKAEPTIDALGVRLAALGKRKDLDLGEKLDLGTADVRRTLRPFERELRREIGTMRLGDRLADAFDTAAPRMADAAGRAAPRVAKAFGDAWLNSGVYGKIFSAAIIGKKLGIFGALGTLAMSRFRKGWGKGGLPCIPCGGPPGAPGGGKKPGGGPPVIVPAGPKGLLKRGARGALRIGKVAGPLGAALAVADALASPSSAGEDDQRTQARHGARPGQHYEWDKTGRRRVPVPNRARPRTSAPTARAARAVHVEIPVKVDGRQVFKAVRRVELDERARNRPGIGR